MPFKKIGRFCDLTQNPGIRTPGNRFSDSVNCHSSIGLTGRVVLWLMFLPLPLTHCMTWAYILEQGIQAVPTRFETPAWEVVILKMIKGVVMDKQFLLSSQCNVMAKWADEIHRGVWEWLKDDFTFGYSICEANAGILHPVLMHTFWKAYWKIGKATENHHKNGLRNGENALLWHI